ncbi:filamentous hemagglutinin N-terminal domain-containing protein, partial [filamentous cyanobacterium LEGE 11480]
MSVSSPFLGLFVTATVAVQPVHAQLSQQPFSPTRTLLSQALPIVPAADGTGTRVNQSGPQFNINGGTLSGDQANLFHSFQRFGLNADQIANFIASPNLQNILGRVVGGDASQINGLVQVTGGNANLFLMNPAGIVFGSNARLNLNGAFTATTATGIKFGDQWFNAVGTNRYTTLLGNPNAFAFTASQSGAIVNAGNLTVADGQALTLIGGNVLNTGNLNAPGGQVTIAAVPGTNQVQINQTGVLLGLRITPLDSNQPNPVAFTPSTLPALLTGGANRLVTGVTVNPDGTLQLTASGDAIAPNLGTATVSGSVDVAGQTGGNVGVFGERVSVINGQINASGTNGGGIVLIGGDYRGQGTLPNATETIISQNSTIQADAVANGNGGRIIAWADQTANIDGRLTARGGALSGDGGLIETSAKQSLNITSTPDASAPRGKGGEWLIDPTNFTIVKEDAGTNEIDVSNINTALNSGTDFIITTNIGGTDVGNITQEEDAPIEKTNGGDATLTLVADNSIFLFGNISSTSGQLNLRLTSGAGGIDLPGQISTNGGAISAIGTVFNTMTEGSFINSGGGDISFKGESIRLGVIFSSSSVGKGGDVLLASPGNIRIDAIEAQGGANSAGGNVEITTGSLFRATEQVLDRNNVSASISTAGGAGGGKITLRNGGKLSNTPFVVGPTTSFMGPFDFSFVSDNATLGAITTGESSILPVESFRQNFRDGRIEIIFTVDESTRNPINPGSPNRNAPIIRNPISPGNPNRNAPIIRNPISPGNPNRNAPITRDLIKPENPNRNAPNVFIPPGKRSLVAIDQPQAPKFLEQLEAKVTNEYTSYFKTPANQPTKTLDDAVNELQKIQTNAGVKPAIVYVSFAPSSPTKLNPQLSDLAGRDQLELILVTADGQALRKTIPGATRSLVQALANQFRDAVVNPVRRRSTNYLLKPASQLYRLLIAPLEPELQQQKIQNLSFIVDRGLRSLPLGALYDANTKSYLIEKYSLGMMPSLV